jgi:hypothetical protein
MDREPEVRDDDPELAGSMRRSCGVNGLSAIAPKLLGEAVLHRELEPIVVHLEAVRDAAVKAQDDAGSATQRR